MRRRLLSGQSGGRYVRVERGGLVPEPAPHWVDVAILDMNHGWPNLGHDSLVYSLLEGDRERRAAEERCGVRVRVISFDVRRGGMVPLAPLAPLAPTSPSSPSSPSSPASTRYAVYVGTGGPGHIDPARNDGTAPESQGVREDGSWEPPLFALFAAIHHDPDAALLAVCHSFGVLCRWSGVARPVLRGKDKGGKSSGVLENVWTREAALHPWFGRFTAHPGGGRNGGNGGNGAGYGRLRILDNRLFDLIEEPRPLPPGALRIGHETLGVGGPPGPALTMMELARDEGGVMPRIFGVNHHPEVVERAVQLPLLEAKLRRGEVSEEWAAERREILTRTYPDEDSDSRLQRTSECTLLGPARFFLYRALRRRAAARGMACDLDEQRVAAEAAPLPA